MKEPYKEGFTKKECPDVGDGKILHVGVSKGVRIIEGPKGRDHAAAALAVDC